MQRKHNKQLLENAKNLRKNMTKEEKHLWYDFLRNYPIKFYRQKILGRYIADFYCAKAKLVIELDGSEHYTPEGKDHDNIRTEYLEKFDLTVLRFLNSQINTNFKGVCEYIDIIVQKALTEHNQTK